MIRIVLVLLLSLLTLPAQAQPRILVMGDSMLATHQNTGRSVGDRLAERLGATVRNQPVPGARIIYRLPLSGAVGFNIAKQYRRGDYDWIVINGGGNDLWLGCGCRACDRRMDAMIRADGRAGAIPRLAVDLRKTGARVVWVGYLRSPGVGSPIEACRDEGDALEARIARMASLVDGIDFVSIADLVPHGDTSFHGFDRIHPSPKGAAAIADRVAVFIAGAQGSARR